MCIYTTFSVRLTNEHTFLRLQERRAELWSGFFVVFFFLSLCH